MTNTNDNDNAVSSGLKAREILPLTLKSREIRDVIPRSFLESKFFSARVDNPQYLEQIQGIITEYSNGNISVGEARRRLIQWIASADSTVDAGLLDQDDQGITNIASKSRMDLILKTNREIQASREQLKRGTEPVPMLMTPAWRFTRVATKQHPRSDWDIRWRVAGNSVDWEGACKTEMVALKTSPIWMALGTGAGGYKDTIGNPYPPFCFGSGMGWLGVGRRECIALGLIEDPNKTGE